MSDKLEGAKDANENADKNADSKENVVSIKKVVNKRGNGGGDGGSGGGHSASEKKNSLWVKNRQLISETIGYIENPATKNMPHGRRFVCVEDLTANVTFAEVLQDEEGRLTNILRPTSIAGLRRAVCDYGRSLGFEYQNPAPNNVEDVVRCMQHMARTIKADSIHSIQQAHEHHGWTWEKLPFSLDQEGETPYFDSILSRCDNPEPLMAWIGSLFDEEASRTQYCWLYGEGDNGKGRLLSFLYNIFGRSACSTQAPNKMREHFWAYEIFGKRFVCFGDEDNPAFVSTGTFKSITGDDYVRIEGKGMPAMSVKMKCKFIFSSNKIPKMDDTLANRKRAMYFEFKPLESDVKKISEAQFDAELLKEAAPFLTRCYRLYMQLCPNHERIPYAAESIKAVFEDKEGEDTVDEMIAACIERPEKDWKKSFITACDIETIVKAYYPSAKGNPPSQLIRKIYAAIAKQWPDSLRTKIKIKGQKQVRGIRGLTLTNSARRTFGFDNRPELVVEGFEGDEVPSKDGQSHLQ